MNSASLLPGYLVKRYRGWRATEYSENRSWYRHLASEGQHPRAMVVTCCDSRINVSNLFEADSGEIFLYRNIANAVPPRNAENQQHGAPAAVEYAVNVLKVAHLVIIGHSSCGGVKGCHDMCAGKAPALEAPDSLLGRWLDHLRPAYERTEEHADPDARLRAMEKEAVLVSLENLTSYDFISEAVKAERLTLHGLWVDIATGSLEQYDPAEGGFRAI